MRCLPIGFAAPPSTGTRITWSPGPLTKKIQDVYFSIVRGESPAYREWLTPVYGSLNPGALSEFARSRGAGSVWGHAELPALSTVDRHA